MIQFRFEGSGSDGSKELPVVLGCDFEFVEEFDGCVTGDVVSVGDDAGVEAFGSVALGLAEEFAAH